VKDQLEHQSMRITVDTYEHLVPGGNKAAVDKLDGLEHATGHDPAATREGNPVLSTRRDLRKINGNG
jgi:hypothetical protein